MISSKVHAREDIKQALSESAVHVLMQLKSNGAKPNEHQLTRLEKTVSSASEFMLSDNNRVKRC